MNKCAKIASQVKTICDLLHQYQSFGNRQRRRVEGIGFYGAFARSLLQGDTPQLASNTFNLVRLRSIQGTDLPTVIPVHRAIRPVRGLRAFVGHRFNDTVTPNLRHNLAIVLSAYSIKPQYADSDSPNGSVYEIILDRMRRCDFAIFDDRETETRPNTLIEIGSAIALRKPHFYFNYSNKCTVQMGRRRERITTASDLAGMLYMPYSEYDSLFREFAVRLPPFLLDRHFARSSG